MACPNNCSSCELPPGAPRAACKSCKNSTNTIDYNEKLCRPNCTNSSHTFDFKSYSCKACPAGTLINQTTRACDPCPKNCKSCIQNNTSNRVECTSCEAGLTLDKDRKLCRRSCFNW
jgi:hypothetical protein